MSKPGDEAGIRTLEALHCLSKGAAMLGNIRRLVHTAGIVLIAIAQIIVVWA